MTLYYAGLSKSKALRELQENLQYRGRRGHTDSLDLRFSRRSHLPFADEAFWRLRHQGDLAFKGIFGFH